MSVAVAPCAMCEGEAEGQLLATPCAVGAPPPDGDAHPEEDAKLGGVSQRLVRELYTELASKSKRQRVQRQRLGFNAGCAKWNREELYLDPELRGAAEASSHGYLRRHSALLVGAGRLEEKNLKGRLALQHFLDIDLEDVLRPPPARRNEDEFVDDPGPMHDVCCQMLLDATRGVYVVDGETFDFVADLEASGLILEESPCEVEQLKEACAARLVEAVRRCLHEGMPGEALPAPALLRTVTVALSQSGLANVERAAASRGGPQVVVGGAEQDVRFALRRLGEVAWNVTLEVTKANFSACVVLFSDEDGDSHEAESAMLACGEGSYMRRAATLLFEVADENIVLAEVTDFCSELVLLDQRGPLACGVGVLVGHVAGLGLHCREDGLESPRGCGSSRLRRRLRRRHGVGQPRRLFARRRQRPHGRSSGGDAGCRRGDSIL